MTTYEPRRLHARSARNRNCAHERFRQRFRRRRQAELAHTTPTLPTVAEIADHELLIETFYDLKSKAGQAPGPDNVRYGDIGRQEVPAIMRDLAKSVADGEFRPSQARHISRPKPSGGTRTLALRSILTRVVSGTLNELCSPYWESIYHDSSYGFRKERNTWQMLLAMEQAIVSEDRFVIAVDDIRQAFDNVSIDAVMDCHRLHTQDQKLLDLVETILRGYERRNREHGIDQGSAYSPTALNVLLHHTLDLPFSNDAANPPWFRYADNLVHLCQSVSEGCEALAKARELLERNGMSLKGDDGDPTDLRQPGTKVNILGLELQWDSDKVVYGLNPAAWEALYGDLRDCYQSSDPSDAANSAIRGWISYCGPAFEGLEEAPLIRRILEVAAEAGFMEVPHTVIRRALQSARDRWRALRERQGLRRNQGNNDTVSPTTVDGNGQVELSDASSSGTVPDGFGCPF